MWSGPVQKSSFCTLSSTVCAKEQSQLGLQSFLYGKGKDHTAEEDTIAIHVNSSGIAGEQVNDKRIAATATRPSTFSACALTDDFEGNEGGDVMPIYLSPSFVDERITTATMAEREVTILWCPQNDHRWLPEESDCSQRSVASCKTQIAVTTPHLGDPGAPIKKNRERGYFCTETDELSTSSFMSAVHQHLDTFNGNNHSVSLLCESSVPSRITVLDEAGESVDLVTCLSHLVVASSPARKRLFSAVAAEDAVDTAGDDCRIARSTKTQPPHRGKRLFDELDLNRDAAVFSPSALAVAREAQHKCRRVDDAGDDYQGFIDCGSSASNNRGRCVGGVGVL